jgi:hypothetical protein
MSFFSPLAQMGWGLWDKHFWILVIATFYPQDYPKVTESRGEIPKVTELRGEMLDHENMGKWEHIIRQLDMGSLQLLSLEFVYTDFRSLVSNRALASFLSRAPNLRSLQLSFWDHPGTTNITIPFF